MKIERVRRKKEPKKEKGGKREIEKQKGGERNRKKEAKKWKKRGRKE